MDTVKTAKKFLFSFLPPFSFFPEIIIYRTKFSKLKRRDSSQCYQQEGV